MPSPGREQPQLLLLPEQGAAGGGNTGGQYWRASADAAHAGGERTVAAPASGGGEAPIRLVVLACKRPIALRSLLASINATGAREGYDGRTVRLDIYVDLPRGSSVHHDGVVSLAREFGWAYGEKEVHLHGGHVGILGQWLTLRASSDDDWFVVLEDDLALSPCFYEYLTRARAAYGGRADVAGIALQPLTNCFLPKSQCGAPAAEGAVFGSRVLASWGYMPRPASWNRFVAWVDEQKAAGKEPVDGLPASLLPVGWYASLKREGRLDSFWTIWHIAYAAAQKEVTLVFNRHPPLVAPHGSQPSEHGNPVDRRPMLAALQPDASPRLPPAALRLIQSDDAADDRAPPNPRGALQLAGSEVGIFDDLLVDCSALSGCCDAHDVPVLGYDGNVEPFR